jgi:hypothetical protein
MTAFKELLYADKLFVDDIISILFNWYHYECKSERMIKVIRNIPRGKYQVRP